ncbi:MAG TPA: shikimate dehydrogenase [Eoetvoesiella sp.]
MTDSTHIKSFAVIGNPIAHSLSPAIHQAFGKQLGVALRYTAIQSPIDGFPAVVDEFFANGGAGLNVTVPFKEIAYAMAQAHLSERASLAGAVNTLWMDHGRLHGCNTDGVGLLHDIQRLGITLQNKRILLVGAGGAAKGVVRPLLQAQCAALHIANRTPERAIELQTHIARLLPQFSAQVTAGSLKQSIGQWDVVINATSSSLGNLPPDLPDGIYAPGALAYDMMYGAQPTSFMLRAQAQGATHIADGLGMLVGQAAASFAIWHGLEPDLAPVLAALRQKLHSA